MSSLARRPAVEAGPAAQLSGGYAHYLPGVGSGSGIGSGERLITSPFSREPVINRAIHFASGSMTAKLGQLDDRYNLAAWVWLGERSGASQRSGLIASAPAGERLIAHQDSAHRLRLELVASGASIDEVLNRAAATEQATTEQAGVELSRASWPAEEWNFVVLVRDGSEVRVVVNGSPQPVLASTIESALPTDAKLTELRLADELQGKLDEIAIFPRALSTAEIAKLWELAGAAPHASDNR